MSRLAASAVLALLPLAVAWDQAASPRAGSEKPKGVRIFNVKSVKQPARAAAELVDIHESEHMVSRVMRLAPGAVGAATLAVKPGALAPGRYFLAAFPSHPDTGRKLGAGRYHVPLDIAAAP